MSIPLAAIRHRPLLVWTLAFVAGVGLGAFGWLGAAGAACGAVLGLILLGAGGRHWGPVAAGLMLTGVACGALRLASFQGVAPADVSHGAGGMAPVVLTGTVVSDPEDHKGRTTLRLRAETLQTARGTAVVTGEAYVSITPDALSGIALDYGDRVALNGHLEAPPDATNPGGFSWREYLARRNVFCQLNAKRPHAVRRLGATVQNPGVRLAWAVRRRVLAAVHDSLPPTQAAVLSGILLGKRTDLAPDLMADFVHTGTVHILASAGLHVGIVAFWLLWLFEGLTLPRKLSAVLIILLLWLYAVACGGRPSVTRAVIMATVYFAAILFERDPDLPTTVAVAALLILLEQPTALLEAGFQLSFLTVLTLALGMPVWERFWRPRVAARFVRPLPRKAVWWSLEMVGLSLLAQIGSAPIVATSYNEVSLLGVFANALVVPMLFIVIPLGFLGAALWNVWHVLGLGLLVMTGWGLHYIVWVVRGCGESVWAARALPTPPPLAVACYYALVVCGAWAFGGRRGEPHSPGGTGHPASNSPSP